MVGWYICIIVGFCVIIFVDRVMVVVISWVYLVVDVVVIWFGIRMGVGSGKM